MGSCTCILPVQLHLRPEGVHLPDGGRPSLVVVDEVWTDGLPVCSVCGAGIEDTFYRCIPCESVLCRTCVAGSVVVVECDCFTEISVTGVQLAARRAAAVRAG